MVENISINAKVKAFIFDVDGTLYQQNKLHRLIFTRIMKYLFTNPVSAIEAIVSILSYRYALKKLRSMKSIDGVLADKQLEIASNICFIKLDTIKNHITRWMEIEPLNIFKNIKYPFSDLFFSEVKKRGYKLAVLSDYPINNKLEALGWKNLFDLELSSQDANINRLKPDPLGINHIIKSFGLTPEEVIYIGDRYEIDAKTAFNAGVDCIIIGKNKYFKFNKKCNKRSYLDMCNALNNV